MNPCLRWLFRKGLPLAVLVGGGLWLSARTSAQEYLEVKQLKGDETRFRTLQNGKYEPPLDESDKKLLDRMAQWYTYRLTWPDSLLDKKTLYNIVDEAFRTIPIPNDPEKPLPVPQQEFMKEYGKALVKHLRKVMQNDRV